MRYKFYTADVFTSKMFGGNPLAVFPDARGLDTELMQRIAREFNLSETAFVFPPHDPAHTRHLRIFTPDIELPFAGHPTIGSAFVLAAIGLVPLGGERTSIVFEEGAGPVPVTIVASGGRPVAAQLSAARRPEVGPPPPEPAALAEVLSLAEGEIRSDQHHPQAISCGVPFLFIPLRSRASLGRIHVNREAWAQHLAGYWAPHIYAIAFEPELPGSHLRARMFAPAMGIAEDPATGAAATALGGYLAMREAGAGTFRWTVEQGFEMGRPSILDVEADVAGGAVVATRVGGASVMVSEGLLDLSGLH